jgi:trimeric autotransporter adhesin
MRLSKLLLFSLTLLLALPAAPQNAPSNPAASAPTAVPPLIPYSGVVGVTAAQQTPTTASVTFLVYDDESGGQPLFSETQSVAVDSTGRFKAQIGATLSNGIPIDLFASGEARWLAIQIAGEPAQPRVLLASVPYALKAADAATLGGLPASAFALASTKSFAPAVLTSDVNPNTDPPVTTTGGFSGYIPVFNGTSSIVNSTIYQNANGIGINGVAYAALDVSGRTIFRGTMVVSRNGNATSTSGVGSVPLQFFANGWNSTIKGPVQPVMQLQAEPTGNNTAAPGATLNLLYNNGTVANPSETGLYFNANGTIHFAPGQTFPGGPGLGTITAVTAGTALTGGGTTGNVTLNLDTTKVPLLAANNIFIGNQSVTGNLTASGTASAGTVNAATYFAVGGLPFAYGSFANGNVYFGFAGGGSTTSGNGNTASGVGALVSNTTGQYNTASGYETLYANTTGNGNTASGAQALDSNTTGYYNVADGITALYYNTTGNDNVGEGTSAGYTADFSDVTGSNDIAVGANSAFGTGSLTNATAIGAYAEVDNSNTLVLGCTSGKNHCPHAVGVGIGTSAPDNLLTVNGSADKPGGGSWGTFSDVRLKNVNGSFASGLGQVMQLRPIRYRYKPDNALGIRDMDEHIGVVAQEVQRVIPEAVTENGKGYLLVNNDPIIWSMVNAIKEQQREIEQQQKLLRAQSAAMKNLAAEVRETRKTLRQVKAQAAAGQTVMVASK